MTSFDVMAEQCDYVNITMRLNNHMRKQNKNNNHLALLPKCSTASCLSLIGTVKLRDLNVAENSQSGIHSDITERYIVLKLCFW